MPQRGLVLFLWVMCFTVISGRLLNAQEVAWNFLKETQGIKVYTREATDSKIKEVKILTTFESSSDALMSTLSDLESFPKWVYGVSKSKLLKKYSNEEMDYYNTLNFPWPLRDRDVAIHSKMYQDAASKIIYSISEAKSNLISEKSSFVRINVFRSTWTFKPENGRIAGEYIFFTDPAGAIPAWAINMALDEGPVKTILNLKDILRDKMQNPKTAAYIIVKH